MINKKKYIINLICLLFMLLFVSACGKKDASALAMEEALNYKEYVFKDEDIPSLKDVDLLGNLSLITNLDENILITSKVEYVTDTAESEAAEEVSVTDESEINDNNAENNEEVEPIQDENGEISTEDEDAVEENAGEVATEVTAEETVIEENSDSGEEASEETHELSEFIDQGQENSKELSTFTVYKINDKPDAEFLFSFKGNPGFMYSNFFYSTEKDLYSIANNYEEENARFFVRINSKGEQVVFDRIMDHIDESAIAGDYFNIMSICEDGGKIYISTTAGLLIYDIKGVFLDFKSINEFDAKLRQSDIRLFKFKNGDVYNIVSEDGKTYFYKLNMSNLKITNEFSIDGYIYTAFVGKGYDILYTSSEGVYAYNLGDEKSHKILDFVASNLTTFDINGIVAFSKDKFAGIIYDDEGPSIKVFTKIPPEEVPDKIELTIGMVYSNYDIKRQLIKFNRESSQYKLNLIDYSTIYSADRGEMIKQINKEISTGSMPDILVVDTTFPIEKYISKGLLADIYPLIDNDPNLSREDLLSNVLEAYSIDGKLYQMVPSFSIESMAMAKDEAHGRTSWTIEEAYNYWKSEGTNKIFCPDINRNEFMQLLISCTSDSYIDWEAGTCDFNSPTFKTSLEMLKKIPDSTDKYHFDDPWADTLQAFRTGDALVRKLTLSNYDDYIYTKDIFGKDIQIIGYPANDGQNGSVIRPSISFAISADTKSMDGVWEYIKRFLTYEWQSDSDKNYVLPIRKDALLAKEQASTERPHFTVQGQTYYYDRFSQIDNDTILPPLSMEEAEELTKFIMSVNTSLKQDTNIENILAEDTQPYFIGQKPMETICKTIQSRIRLYIGESR